MLGTLTFLMMPLYFSFRITQGLSRFTSYAPNQLNTTTLRQISVFPVRRSHVPPASHPMVRNAAPPVLTPTTSLRMSPASTVSATASNAPQPQTAHDVTPTFTLKEANACPVVSPYRIAPPASMKPSVKAAPLPTS